MVHLFAVCGASRRIFDTTIIVGNDDTFDCLIRIGPKVLPDFNKTYRSRIHNKQEIQRFCRRFSLSNNYQMSMTENLTMPNHTAFSFVQLRSMNITQNQLHKWYAPIDLIEEYNSGEENGSFVNCSDTLWFGSKCEYTFDSDEIFSELLTARLNAKEFLPTDLSLFTNGTCYEMINTNCESIICLDWREICDGKIDCKNGYDEYHCQELEKNECDKSTEYRCYDGECVDDTLGFSVTSNECSEDYSNQNDCASPLYKEYSIECENQKCPRLFFSCGDGSCYDGPSIGSGSCRTQRDRRYLQQMPSSSLILFSHVLLIYNNTQPELICYNQTLCPYLSSNSNITTTRNGLPCHAFETFTNQKYNQFDEMVQKVKRLIRSCSLLPSSYNQPYSTCSMFQCKSDSKCLSFHRLSDDVEDCINGEDERQTHVCSLGLRGRFMCDNGTKCFAQHTISELGQSCTDKTDQYPIITALTKCSNPFSGQCHIMESMPEAFIVKFHDICNGLVEYLADLNNNTDESDCLPIEWPCDKRISKCDRLLNCPDGRDELGCNVPTPNSLYCNNNQHFCLEINTGRNICLSNMGFGDGIIDCVGSVDEREFCRTNYPYEQAHRYRCQNSTKCIGFFSVCDCRKDCPENDDETTACDWLYKGPKWCGPSRTRINDDCSRFRDKNYDGRSDLYCNLVDQRDVQFWEKHQAQTPSSIITEHRIKRQSEENPDHSVIWSCNRGIYVRSTKDSEGFACLCPEYYYGRRCEYQRKRVKTAFHMQMLTSFNHNSSAFKFVVLLVHTNKTAITIISHNQFTYIPRYLCSHTFHIQLLYPINEPYRSFINHSVRIHMFDSQTLEHRYSRTYSLSFEFLPVQTIAKRLFLPETETDLESGQVSIPYSSCTSCSNTSYCLGHDVILARDICICPPKYAGRRCLFLLNPCTDIDCNGHGICQSLDVYQDLEYQFVCVCNLEWTGRWCELRNLRINILLTRDVTFLSSNKAFLHVMEIESTAGLPPHYIYFQRLQKEISNFTFIIEELDTIQNNAFVQFYEHQYKFDYYLLFLHKFNQESRKEIPIEVNLSHRCRSINELFDANILAQPAIRRVKNYQQPCLQRQYNKDQLLCFYDDYLMCICNEDNYTNCFHFQTNMHTCEKKWCTGRGMCVQDEQSCGSFSLCICEPCAYGTYCQFTTAGYTLSLDGIIGSHILLTARSFSEQSEIIRISLIIMSLVIVLGIILNILSIGTFIRKETHEVGCGLYLLTSSIIGLFTQIILICKIVVLLMGQRNNASCSVVEFFLKWCPTSCEWLNACVAIERTIAVKREIQYSRSQSKYFAKWIVPTILILVGLICIPEYLFRGITTDDIDNRAWCVLTLNSERPGLLAIYSILNILSFLIPLTINLLSGIIIILGLLQAKQKTNKNNYISIKQSMTWRIHLKLIRIQILKHKHILLAPAILGCLSFSRLILTFVFVCTKLDQNSIPSLIAYLVGFLPSMAIIFAFICPSQAYRSALVKSLKAIVPKYVQNLFASQN